MLKISSSRLKKSKRNSDRKLRYKLFRDRKFVKILKEIKEGFEFNNGGLITWRVVRKREDGKWDVMNTLTGGFTWMSRNEIENYL